MRMLTRSALVKGAMVERMMVGSQQCSEPMPMDVAGVHEALEGILGKGDSTALEMNLHEERAMGSPSHISCISIRIWICLTMRLPASPLDKYRLRRVFRQHLRRRFV